jgi:hypothetical protein
MVQNCCEQNFSQRSGRIANCVGHMVNCEFFGTRRDPVLAGGRPETACESEANDRAPKSVPTVFFNPNSFAVIDL